MSKNVRVLKEQCATCIFKPGNLMSLNKGRVKGMVDSCKANSGHIPCHETMTYEDEGDLQTTYDSPICRGFYDRYPDVSQMAQIAERLGMFEVVEQKDV